MCLMMYSMTANEETELCDSQVIRPQSPTFNMEC